MICACLASVPTLNAMSSFGIICDGYLGIHRGKNGLHSHMERVLGNLQGQFYYRIISFYSLVERDLLKNYPTFVTVATLLLTASIPLAGMSSLQHCGFVFQGALKGPPATAAPTSFSEVQLLPVRAAP